MARSTQRTASFRVPLWMVILAVIPLAVFFASLLLAVGVVGLAVAATALVRTLLGRPSQPQRSPLAPARRGDAADAAIELDRSEYRRIPDGGRER